MMYRNGDFFIGEKLIPKRSSKDNTTDGIWFNSTGYFEAWKGAKLLGRIHWRNGDKAARKWLKKFESPANPEKSERDFLRSLDKKNGTLGKKPRVLKDPKE